jgi:6-phosphogluconolactonase
LSADTITSPRGASVEVHADAHAASRAAAERFAELARDAVDRHGRFSVALTGGGSPKEMYGLLAEEPFVSRVPWEGVHLFWGDERCVGPRHPRSNYAMAWDAFVGRVPVPMENVHRMRGEMRPADGASAYAEELARFFGLSAIPRFDLVLLGVGPDAHVASLFPFDAALHERVRTVTTAIHRPLGEPRITLTLPVLNAAARVEMIVLGRDKADVVRKVLRGPLDPFRLPAQFVRPIGGEMLWTLDAGAVAGLEGG